MLARLRSARPAILAGVVIFTTAAAVAVGHYAGFSSAPGRAELSASQSIDQRFPQDWRARGPSQSEQAFASSDALWFQPNPLYPIKSESEGTPTLNEELTSSVWNAGRETVEPAAKPLHSIPAKRRSNAVLSDAQISGIKKRLNLTAAQERYWPAVAAELRKMEYKKDPKAQGTRTASVDMSKMDVAGLRSAGLPLVMSFDDEQKEQLKGLAHLLGIEAALPGL